MRKVRKALSFRKENVKASARFNRYPVDVNLDPLRDELERAFRQLDEEFLDSAETINANEGSAIVVPGTSTSDLPAPARELQGKIFQVTDTGGADTGYVCIWNGAAYAWLSIY